MSAWNHIHLQRFGHRIDSYRYPGRHYKQYLRQKAEELPNPEGLVILSGANDTSDSAWAEINYLHNGEWQVDKFYNGWERERGKDVEKILKKQRGLNLRLWKFSGKNTRINSDPPKNDVRYCHSSNKSYWFYPADACKRTSINILDEKGKLRPGDLFILLKRDCKCRHHSLIYHCRLEEKGLISYHPDNIPYMSKDVLS